MKLPSNPNVKRSRIAVILLGILLVLTALLVNKWSIELLISSDGDISSLLFMGVIAALQIGALIAGFRLLWSKPELGFSLGLYSITVFVLLAGVFLGGFASLEILNSFTRDRQTVKMFHAVNEAEDVNMLLMLQLDKLRKSVMNLQLPDYQSSTFFDNQVKIVDLAAQNPPSSYTEFLPNVDVSKREWRIAVNEFEGSSKKMSLWRPLFAQVAYFEHAKFSIKKGRFLDESHHEFETEILFSGVARMKSQGTNGTRQFPIASITGSQIIRWKKQPPALAKTETALDKHAEATNGKTESDTHTLRSISVHERESSKLNEATWFITGWHMKNLETMETQESTFVEILDAVLSNPEDLAKARRSIHEEMVVKLIKKVEDFKKPHKRFRVHAGARHPGISVVDLDRDGFDDIYVMARWGENMFFHNRGDGTFEEIAAELGLNIKDHTTAAIFADFDNDGDTDVFLGRSMGRSKYLINENGKFSDRSAEMVDIPMPYLVTSVSAVDYNGDGLLDIYLSTYGDGISVFSRGRRSYLEKFMERFNDTYLEDYLPEEDAKELHRLRRSSDSHMTYNRYGPPNILLKNVGGGRFEVAKGSPALRVFRSTFQATWADFDGDGDPDVYLASDFAPNNLIRNDGDGKFVDITEETGTADFGFGMGATWGDYDNDGKQDLYVTNMYSKAGRRITAQIPGLDSRFILGARGNSLFRNTSHGTSYEFKRVSGLEAPELMVEKGGWGWGSQFIDFDNDGYLDIYALNGFFTAPAEVAIAVDT